jgi:hypothetical protein
LTRLALLMTCVKLIKNYGSADFSGEQDKLGEDFHESKEEVFGVCNASQVGTK